MKKFLFTAIMLSALVFVLFSCKGKGTVSNNGKPNVITTNFPPYDFVRAITGDKVNINMLVPPGAESHSFEPTPQDIKAIQNCDVFIYTGGEGDAWVDRILKSLEKKKLKIVRMMDAVDVVEEETVEGMEEDEDEEEAAYDEHVWTSPKNARLIVQAITEALCEIDSANAELFRQNAEGYIESLGVLDKQFQAVVDGAKRKTIVFADRFPFRYFADAYGLKYFAAFPGCSTETEPSAATVAFLIKKIREEKIPVVFHIELSNERMANTIAGETGAKKLLFHACHNVSKQDFVAGLGYLDFMRRNVENLRQALY